MPLATPVEATVPFLDLAPSHRAVRDEILEDVAAILDAGSFTNGPEVARFEDAFAAYCGTRHCVGVASGLDALRLALLAVGVGPGSEVILPAMTFVATAEAVTQAGATPVLVDVSERDLCLDVDAAARAVTPRTRAILPVHLYGQLADLRRLAPLADAHGLAVVEDACQAHGAEREGVRAGAGGRAAAFSFYPGKNLGALGDAGAVTTDDGDAAARVRALREHGQTAKYRHDRQGWTSRLDTIQAAVLLRKLAHLDAWTEERRAAAAFYRAELAGLGDLVLPAEPAGSDPVWHLFVVRTSAPAELAAFLAGRGIATGRHYPHPVHLTRAYAHLGHARGDFPVAESIADGSLSLPLFPGISEEQLGAVVAALAEYAARA